MRNGPIVYRSSWTPGPRPHSPSTLAPPCPGRTPAASAGTAGPPLQWANLRPRPAQDRNDDLNLGLQVITPIPTELGLRLDGIVSFEQLPAVRGSDSPLPSSDMPPPRARSACAKWQTVTASHDFARNLREASSSRYCPLLICLALASTHRTTKLYSIA